MKENSPLFSQLYHVSRNRINVARGKLDVFIFQGIYKTGSYFDGLRVKRADEFDLNVILTLPWSFQGQAKLRFGKATKGFAKICLDETKHLAFACSYEDNFGSADSDWWHEDLPSDHDDFKT